MGNFEAVPYRSVLHRWVIQRRNGNAVCSLGDYGVKFMFDAVLGIEEQWELMRLQLACSKSDFDNELTKLKNKR